MYKNYITSTYTVRNKIMLSFYNNIYIVYYNAFNIVHDFVCNY